jgi:hypothetical protein
MRPQAPSRRGGAFSLVSTVLQIGHALVAVPTIAFGLFVLVQLSPARHDVGRWEHPILVVVIGTVCLHIVLMLATAVWSWLAARGQKRVSALWAWLGYLIPVAGLWLPPQTLHGLVTAAGPDNGHLRGLVVAWGIARGLATPSVTLLVLFLLFGLRSEFPAQGGLIVGYWIIAIAADNLLSLVMIGQMRRHLAINAINERHAEVFA